MKYHLKIFIIGVLGGNGYTAGVVNEDRRTLGGWSRTTPPSPRSGHQGPDAHKMATARLSAREHYPAEERHITKATTLLRKGAARVKVQD